MYMKVKIADRLDWDDTIHQIMPMKRSSRRLYRHQPKGQLHHEQCVEQPAHRNEHLPAPYKAIMVRLSSVSSIWESDGSYKYKHIQANKAFTLTTCYLCSSSTAHTG